MNETERKHFLAIDDADEKERYIKRQGIDVRYVMHDRLRVGQTQDAVKEALDGVVGSWNFESSEWRLYGSSYNGEATTHSYCVFAPRDDEGIVLVNWGSFTDQHFAEQRDILKLETVLKDRLERVLETGMTTKEITSSYQTALNDLERYKANASARRKSELGVEYAGFSAPSVSDYQVETEWLRAHAQADFYSVLELTTHYVRREGDIEYWYHVIPYRDDSEFYTVVEYRIQAGRLLKWYVYHTDFLGFGRYK
jgi:hypothetical protein